MSEEKQNQPDDAIRPTPYGIAIAALLRIEDICEDIRDCDVSDIHQIAVKAREAASKLNVETIAAGVQAANAERDKAYRERAALVAYLSAVYPSVIAPAPDAEGWAIVYVSTPSGQMSWHIAYADVEQFGHLTMGDPAEWDGHTTEQKYERLAELTRTVATGLYGPQPSEAGQ